MEFSPKNIPEAEHQFRSLVEAYAVAQGVAPSHRLFRHFVEADSVATYAAGLRIRRELSWSGELRDQSVLDVGSGFGGTLVSIAGAGARVVGLEYDRERLRLCRERLALHGARAGLVRGDGFSLPFPTGCFDVVVCSEVLEHVPRKRAFVEEMIRTLKSGGLLYLSFPNRRSITNLLRDPHYQLPLISVLPPRIAAWCVRRARGLHYEVDDLPAASVVTRWCRDMGVDVASLIHSERVLVERVSNPMTVRRNEMRAALVGLQKLRLSSAVKAAIRFRSGFGASAVLVGRKS